MHKHKVRVFWLASLFLIVAGSTIVLVACQPSPSIKGQEDVSLNHVPVVTTGTVQPAPPPKAKWQAPISVLDLATNAAIMRKTDQDITFSIHDIIIHGNEVVVFFSTHNATNVGQAWPEIVHLEEKVLESRRAIPQANFAVPPKKPLTILEQLDNVVLGALTFEIPEVHPPLLSMVVSKMIVHQEGVGESHLTGDWTVPLLEDQTPDRPVPYALQLFTTAPPEGIVYNGVKVFEGDDEGTNSGIAGAPEQTGSVTWFFAFTLSSPNEQKNVYLFLMTDGTIQKVERKDYLATLGLLYVQPTQLPATVPVGPDAEETFVPPSTTPTLVLRLEDVLKSFAPSTPANQPVDVPTLQPFISPTGTAYPQAPGR